MNVCSTPCRARIKIPPCGQFLKSDKSRFGLVLWLAPEPTHLQHKFSSYGNHLVDSARFSRNHPISTSDPSGKPRCFQVLFCSLKKSLFRGGNHTTLLSRQIPANFGHAQFGGNHQSSDLITLTRAGFDNQHPARRQQPLGLGH